MLKNEDFLVIGLVLFVLLIFSMLKNSHRQPSRTWNAQQTDINYPLFLIEQERRQRQKLHTIIILLLFFVVILLFY